MVPVSRGQGPVESRRFHACPLSLEDSNSTRPPPCLSLGSAGGWLLEHQNYFTVVQGSEEVQRDRDGEEERSMQSHVARGELASEVTWHHLLPSFSLKLSPGGGEMHPTSCGRCGKVLKRPGGIPSRLLTFVENTLRSTQGCC